MGSDHRPITAPSRWLQFIEGRAFFEFSAFLASSPVLSALGRGDGHPVLVVPGFMAGDSSTQPLRSVLEAQGYAVHGWRLGRNRGPTAKIVDVVHARLDALTDRHGRAVTLIGQSLGGIFAREMARRNPEAV